MRFTVVLGAMFVCVTGAHANVPDYCAAYARDFADKVQKQDTQWQRRYDNAEKDCMFRFTVDAQPKIKAKPMPKPKRVAAIKPPAVPAKVKPEPDSAPAPAPQQEAATTPKLQPGSPAWTSYCKKKYVSFNEAKGTYLSKTGKARKCLVTAD